MKGAYVFIVALLFSLNVCGQAKNTPSFERRVTIDMRNETVEAVLTEISRQAEITFSYSPKAINASKQISLSIEKQTVRYTLNKIFDNSILYHERGKFIILQPAKQKKNDVPAIVEGYLTTPQGDLLPDATIYNATHKTVVTTDKYGYFHLKMDAKNTPDTLKVSKLGFENTLLMPIPGKTTFVTLTLPEGNNNNHVAIENQPDFFPSKLVKHELQVNSTNVTETFNRVFQLSFVPHIGTNSLLSGSSSNLISLNILGGYTESVKVFEAGSVMNIVRGDAGVFQTAGIVNFVGGKFNGFQCAGLINHTRKSVKGFQAAGLYNITGENFKGFQAADIMNLTNGCFTGFQAAGILNNTKYSCNGVQISGIVNIAREVNGCQLAGILNTAQKVNGLQMSCIVNQSKQNTGAQVAGIINVTDTVNGIQAACLVNRAEYVKGVQLGVVNIADSCSGAQIGIVNIYKNGYHQVDIYATETFYTNVAYRGGTKHFYSIFMGGYDPRTLGSSPLYTLGVGIGTSFGQKPKLGYDADLVCQQVYLGVTASNINMLYRLGFGVNYKITHNVALTLGLTYNVYLVDSSTSEYETTFSKLPPYSISNELIGTNENLKTWVGFKAGIRLF